MGNPMDNNARFSASGSGQYEDASIDGSYRLLLFGIQLHREIKEISSRRKEEKEAVFASFKGTTFTSNPRGISEREARKASRTNLLKRFRVTASP
jgi:hypothetical protein